MTPLDDMLISPEISIREVMACIDRNAKGIALVLDAECRLIGTITDGDIRRAILAGIDLDLPVQALQGHWAPLHRPAPLTAPVGTPDTQLLRMMNAHTLRHIPLVDATGRVVDVALLSDLVKEHELSLTAVVMAGGYGTRLYPLTERLPKPMLPVGGRPLLELIIEQLCQAGIRRVNLATHYQGKIIAQHFGDGRDFGVEISYVKEDQPLGTAGALGLLDTSAEPVLVINGDILTRLDFRAMLNFHREHQADMTVAVGQYEFQVPYGVIETSGVTVTGISEKPVVRHFINAGIYLLHPEVCRFVPNDQPYDMPELISRLVAEGCRVVSFPVREYWLDIGQIEDYEKALVDVENGGV
jgi:dTDP-glucose pyrophosphorylase/CBS domain-containing protein